MKHLAGFPWATWGRRESEADFWRNIQGEKERISFIPHAPLISLLVVCGEDTSKKDLARTLESIEEQSYPHWEVIVVASQKTKFENEEIRTVSVAKKSSFSERVNAAKEKTTGSWLGIVEAGDVLSPAALYLLANELQKKYADVIYTNEVALGGKTPTYFSKRRFSWVTLLHQNYIGRFWLMKRSVWDEAGSWDEKLGAYAEQAFLLKVSERTEAFGFLSAFLYYRNSNPKKDSSHLKAWEEWVKRHLERSSFEAHVRQQESSLRITPRFLSGENPRVSAVICFRNRSEWTLRCVESLGREIGGVPVEVILVNNCSTELELKKVEAGLKNLPVKAKLVHYDGTFNFARMNNWAIRTHASGNQILLLNNDAFFSGTGRLDEMVAWSALPWVGTVGVLLRYPGGGVQHSGLRAFFGGDSRMVRVGNAQEEDTNVKEVFGSTFAACLFKRSIFEKVGGLRELEMVNGLGDVAFNLECLKQGFKNLYLGHVDAVHMESASRGLTYEYWEECELERDYPDLLYQALREDLGINRVPSEEYSVVGLLGHKARVALRTRAPWLRGFKQEFDRRLLTLKVLLPKTESNS